MAGWLITSCQGKSPHARRLFSHFTSLLVFVKELLGVQISALQMQNDVLNNSVRSVYTTNDVF